MATKTTLLARAPVSVAKDHTDNSSIREFHISLPIYIVTAKSILIINNNNLKDEEDKKELSRQVQRYKSQVDALDILTEEVIDRANHVNKCTGNLSRYRERQRLLSHLEALKVIGERMKSRGKVLIELERRSEAGETIFTGDDDDDDDEYDGGGGSTKEDISNSVTQLLYEICLGIVACFILRRLWDIWFPRKSSKGPWTEEVGEGESASDSSPPRNAAEAKSEGGDEELPELQYLAKP
ncbi:hypothetical protein COL516b_010243 [Colletotrichum fioriniae]|nr:uncharacterized protein COL516b_010243 [Colletotrichum fioriniae]KAJ0298092.1 hypothetical protein COL516b_010243 [Colletotrichum fioriniae]